jgi:hypothetical protein
MGGKLKVLLINVLVLIVLLGSVEAYFRVFKSAKRPRAATQNFALQMVPYQMFSNWPHQHYTYWDSQWSKEPVPTDTTGNNHGFNDRHEFNLTKPYQKMPNERVVLIAGGSVVWGVGSSSPEMTIAGRMEHYLNTMQSDIHYTVINLGGGNFISFQEFIVLELWGSVFQPDWVVVMDGQVDGLIGCAESQGVMNPAFFAAMSSFINAYFSASTTIFYRGWLENVIIKYSAAYRALSGKEYIPNPMEIDSTNTGPHKDGDGHIIFPTKLSEAHEMAAFYVKSEDAMIRLYPDARYIVSTAPSVNDFKGDFTDVYESQDANLHDAAMVRREQEVEQNLTAHENESCNLKSVGPAQIYVNSKGAFDLERMAAAYRKRGRYVEYQNIGKLLPEERQDRIPYFIDPDHLSDKGADLIGRFYAQRILAADSAAPRQ